MSSREVKVEWHEDDEGHIVLTIAEATSTTALAHCALDPESAKKLGVALINWSSKKFAEAAERTSE